MTALSPSSTADEVIAHLRAVASEDIRAQKSGFGIITDRSLGVTRDVQRAIAKAIKRDHQRAVQLWDSGITEAQFIAAMTADPKQLTVADARRWASEFDSWDIVDGVSDLFVDTDHWRDLIDEFAADEREYVRRTAFAMIAWAAVHRKQEPDETFVPFFALVERHATDQRNFVRKAVNWALRQIGKRSPALHAPAMKISKRLAASSDKTARWIGKDALRELSDPKRIEAIAARAAKARKRA
jgi:3-methyladenine DNA glycosylase AlkD